MGFKDQVHTWWTTVYLSTLWLSSTPSRLCLTTAVSVTNNHVPVFTLKLTSIDTSELKKGSIEKVRRNMPLIFILNRDVLINLNFFALAIYACYRSFPHSWQQLQSQLNWKVLCHWEGFLAMNNELECNQVLLGSKSHRLDIFLWLEHRLSLGNLACM